MSSGIFSFFTKALLVSIVAMGFGVGCNKLSSPMTTQIQNVVLINESNLAEASKVSDQLIAESKTILQAGQKSQLTSKEIREKLSYLPQVLGVGSEGVFKQIPELVDSTPLSANEEAAVRGSYSGVRGAVATNAVAATDTTEVDLEPEFANGVVGAFWQLIFGFLNNLPPSIPGSDAPPTTDPTPEDLVVAFQPPLRPPPIGAGGPPPEEPVPLPPNGGGGQFVGPPVLAPQVPCTQFNIGGFCCNVAQNGRGGLADRCTLYYKIPTRQPGIFFFGNCSWIRGVGFDLNCPDPRYFTGWKCAPRDPNAC